MQIQLTAIPNAIEARLGLPRVNWPVVRDWVGERLRNYDEDELWSEIARQWLGELQRALPAGYAPSESNCFILLSQLESGESRRILRWCELYRQLILDSLPDAARDDTAGKCVVIVCRDEHDYYNYLADFYPEEGEFGRAGGMFISEGHPHILLSEQYKVAFERSIAHELAHFLLHHLSLPIWLDEGVTQLVEDIVLDTSYFGMNHELKTRHRQYWNRETVMYFWRGDSFFAADDGQELSYSLAQVLVRNMLADYRSVFCEFLRAASSNDAGESAALEILGESLGDRVAQFLGPGDWTPRIDAENPIDAAAERPA
jgi:hypothetical protein